MQDKLIMDKSGGKLGIVEFLVSVYFVLAACYLILTKSIQVPSFTKVIRSKFRKKAKLDLLQFTKEQGFCWVANVPSNLLSDEENISSLVLYENGNPLSLQHSSHEEIRKIGLGRYSHWGNQIYLSTTDNSDPSSNKRNYSVREM